MKNHLDVSVIIVNWNTSALLRGCLQSVYQQTSKLRFEVIVVDNASTDGSLDMIRQLFPKSMVIANGTNKGYATAVNQGIRIARGRYFLILNSDTVICDMAIEKTFAYANDHPSVAVVGCQVWKNAEQVQPTCFRFPSLLNLLLDTLAVNRVFKKNHFLGREHMHWWLRDSEREVDVVSGMFMLVRGEAVEQVGLMDEQYFLLSEETDWCYRFARAGWKTMFWPGARIIHVHGGMQSRKKASLKMMVQFQKSRLLFFRKHYTVLEYLLARALLVFRCGSRCMIWGIISIFKKLMGKDTTYQVEKTRGLWWSFLFCVVGYQLGAEEAKRSNRANLRALKEIVEFVFAILYWTVCAATKALPRRVVIYYHSLKGKDVWRFEKQMAYLVKHYCSVWASEITVPQNGSKARVSVTFDDALASFCDNALPVLRRYRLPATVFVPTGNLGKAPDWTLEEDFSYSDEIVMNEKAVSELDNCGYEILSHTVSHPYLTEIDETRLEAELAQSKKVLERIVRHDVLGISYPYGAYNDKILKAAERAGYEIGFSIEPCSVESSPDNFQIGRFLVFPTDGMLKFKLKVSGAYQVVKYLKVLKRMLVRT